MQPRINHNALEQSAKPSGVGSLSKRLVTLVQPCSEEERNQWITDQQAAIQERLFQKAKSRPLDNQTNKPRSYERPVYNTPQYWRDCSRGWINQEQQQNDHADFETRRKRAVDSKHNKAKPFKRHGRSAPRPTKQFVKPMSTEAARDDRLTPQSKALLQVIVARTGRGRSTDTTKTTLGVIMNRCPRSIQRYVQELIKFGYIRTQTIKSRRTGFYVGMRIWIMNSVLPFFAKQKSGYNPEEWCDLIRKGRNREETKESLSNDKYILLNTFEEKKPPWFAELAYR